MFDVVMSYLSETVLLVFSAQIKVVAIAQTAFFSRGRGGVVDSVSRKEKVNLQFFMSLLYGTSVA